MTLEELEKNWQKYAIRCHECSDENHTVLMKNRFICLGEKRGGLMFDTGSEGSPYCILKPGPNNECFSRIDFQSDVAEAWEQIGIFVEVAG